MMNRFTPILSALLIAVASVVGAAAEGEQRRGECACDGDRAARVGELVGVDLPGDRYRRYYEGFANSALWPVLHSRPDLIRTDAGETWTTTKLLRRLAWHEPAELVTMRALATP